MKIHQNYQVSYFVFRKRILLPSLPKVNYKFKFILVLHIFISAFQDYEHIGDVYQDEFNQAALLLYRDKTDDALQMVS